MSTILRSLLSVILALSLGSPVYAAAKAPRKKPAAKKPAPKKKAGGNNRNGGANGGGKKKPRTVTVSVKECDAKPVRQVNSTFENAASDGKSVFENAMEFSGSRGGATEVLEKAVAKRPRGKPTALQIEIAKAKVNERKAEEARKAQLAAVRIRHLYWKEHRDADTDEDFRLSVEEYNAHRKEASEAKLLDAYLRENSDADLDADGEFSYSEYKQHRLSRYFSEHPEADNNQDGTLSMSEYKEHRNAR